jgi:hypothetical protein
MHDEDTIVANEFQELKLGKGVAFVKIQLRRLRQEDDVWEADFLPLPCSESERPNQWFGMVISHTDDYLLAELIVETRPTVNDLAKLLAYAMRRPLIEVSHRPKAICLRAKPEWTELLPHLKEVGIEVVAQDELPKWDEAFEEFTQLTSDRSSSAPTSVEKDRMIDDDPMLLRVGKAQMAAMFARQERWMIDDSEFLPLVEEVLTAFETAGADRQLVEQLWEHAFFLYDQACKNAEPESTTEENRQLMQSYLQGRRRRWAGKASPR